MIGEPVAAATSVTELPEVIVWLVGWMMKMGAISEGAGGGAAATINWADWLVAEPAELVATTV